MQAPACANCIRRKECCEYAGVFEKSSANVHCNDLDLFANFCHLPVVCHGHGARSMTPGMPNNQHSVPGMATSNTSSIGTMLQAVMRRSWFTPVEAGVWSKAILDHVHKHPYLQHCVYSVAYLRRDLLDNPSNGCTSAVAYEHHMAASALFRQRTTPVQRDNWVPTLSFHVFMLVFEFASQSACADSQYNLVDTLRVLRSSHAIEEEAKPYFRASKFWHMVSSRDQAKYEVDPVLEINLLALGGVCAELASSHAYNAALNLQALTELRQWVTFCDAHPRRWDHYCHWPGHLDPMFLQLLADGDDFASLLVVYWSAILYRSPKPAVYEWARRTAWYTIGKLKERSKWETLLIWPLQILGGSKDLEFSKINIGEQAKMTEVDKQLRALDVTDTDHHEAEDTFMETMTPDVPHPLATPLTSSSSSFGSPDHLSSEGAISTCDSAWIAETCNTPCYGPDMNLLTDFDMSIDPTLLPVEGWNDAYLADWQTQDPIQSTHIELRRLSEPERSTLL